MKLSLEQSQVQLIRRYTTSGFNINQQLYEHNVLLFPDRVEAWAEGSVKELRASDLAPLSESGIEFLVLGTGEQQRFPSTETLAPLLQQGIGVEVMDTGAACRTYNILASDGRALAAVLYMI